MGPEKPERTKRKKISRACNHCSKAHITCDEARPCRRCIQKGLQETCADAPRKKKKYLDDFGGPSVPDVPMAQPERPQDPSLANAIYDFEARNPQLHQATVFQNNTLPNYFNSPPQFALEALSDNYYQRELGPFYRRQDIKQYPREEMKQYPQEEVEYPEELRKQLTEDESLSNHENLERKRPNFASSAADLEYSTLSNILSVHHTNLSSNGGTPTSNIHSPALSPHGGTPCTSLSSLVTNSYAAQVFAHAEKSDRLPFDTRINQYVLGKTPYFQSILFPDVMNALQREDTQLNSESALSFTIAFPDTHDPNSLFSSHDPLFKAPEEIYAKISKPFSYTPGYHKLIAYLRGRFPKDMLVKLAKSMAVYRPSFIACTNSLRESDLIFMEQCFQRTLLTYNDFIRISGTPTIVWRRTGEIAYVGDEFCVLTGWTRSQLIGPRPMFIVELLDDKSVVEYFELFSKIAFGDFLGATMTECTLITPKGVRIRAGCIWTLKRDVFGIPMMIIGNFLPIV